MDASSTGEDAPAGYTGMVDEQGRALPVAPGPDPLDVVYTDTIDDEAP